MTRRLKIACAAGGIAGVLFLLGFFVVCQQISDAQVAIGLFLSPLYATWVGVGSGCVAYGVMGIAARHSETGEEVTQSLLALVVGLIALGVMISFLVAEAILLRGSP